MNGHYLSKSKCKACPANCDVCDTGTTCVACSTGYFMNADKICAPCLTNCDKCGS